MIRLQYRGEPKHIPKMGYFFLLQMDDSFAEGLCFDTPKEREGGAPTPRSPILCEGKAKGPESHNVGVVGTPTP